MEKNLGIGETQTYWGVKVGQASAHAAERVLGEAGYRFVWTGFTDGSTTWTVLLMREDDSPTEKKDAYKARQLLWDEGWSSVEIVSEAMPV